MGLKSTVCASDLKRTATHGTIRAMETTSQLSVVRFDSALLEEWDACHHYARELVLRDLQDIGLSPRTLEYAGGLRLYYRASYLLSCWGPDRDVRRQVTSDIGAHIVSMKLLDDLVDNDTGMDRFDLGGGVVGLLLKATERLAAYRNATEVFSLLEAGFSQICRGQIKCKHAPAQTLEQWLGYADEYGARFLSLYGRVAGIVCGLGAQAAVPESFASAFGAIITIADDLTDYTRNAERDGNLGSMLLRGVVAPTSIVNILEGERHKAREALKTLAPAFDLAPVVDQYADDVLQRLLPQFAAGEMPAC